MTSAAVVSRAGTHPTVARWVLAVALVLGVLGMHALMGPPTGVPTDGAMSMSMAAHADAAYADAGTSRPADQGHAPAGGHSVLSMCLAVLASLATLLLLSALAARWPASDAAPTSRRPSALARAGRPPPRTVPSLHQLCLLRV